MMKLLVLLLCFTTVLGQPVNEVSRCSSMDLSGYKVTSKGSCSISCGEGLMIANITDLRTGDTKLCLIPCTIICVAAQCPVPAPEVPTNAMPGCTFIKNTMCPATGLGMFVDTYQCTQNGITVEITCKYFCCCAWPPGLWGKIKAIFKDPTCGDVKKITPRRVCPR